MTQTVHLLPKQDVNLENAREFSFFPSAFSASQLCTNYHLIFNATILMMLTRRHPYHCCGFGLKIWFLEVNIYVCRNQGEGLVNWDLAWICILLDRNDKNNNNKLYLYSTVYTKEMQPTVLNKKKNNKNNTTIHPCTHTDVGKTAWSCLEYPNSSFTCLNQKSIAQLPTCRTWLPGF